MNPSLDYLPRLPRRKDFRVGYVGVGSARRLRGGRVSRG
jgi:hypothetical protein